MRYERRRAATQKAAAVKAEGEETLRQKMEHAQAKPPIRLTKKEMALIDKKHKIKKKKLLPRVRAQAGG